MLLRAKRRYLNVTDHLRHLPKGLTSAIVPFDTPGRIYKGTKVRIIATELLD